MDYLIKLFSRMSDSGTALSEHEATALLPYLVMKAGDSKDAVRQSVRNIFKLVVNLYPPNRLFVFVSNGVKSKTNKTRQGRSAVCSDNTFSQCVVCSDRYYFYHLHFILVRHISL
ncbi:unnamed protein product [Echinostoma caproni]|uniref:Protein SDA1 n=1 Tax=Echinostoma caproni TaxID=27848 RepID=A0A183A395_9TREM|nr:unnamed protein product [Echinostoma caproni]